MEVLKQPRFWLFVWGGIGAALLVYVIIAASVQPGPDAPPSALNQDRTLLTGEMADFEYTFPPRRAPQIAFQQDGENIMLSDFRGKAILVNFWATWCVPCLAELPSLSKLQAELGDKHFEVVAIAADPKGPDAAREFLNRHNISGLRLYADPRLIFSSASGADVLPVSILYDANGREIGRLVGEADWSSPEAVRLVGSAKP